MAVVLTNGVYYIATNKKGGIIAIDKQAFEENFSVSAD